MDETETPSATLDEARAAVAERAWGRAHELFAAVAAERPLEAEDLERFAKAAFWIGAADGAISIRESAYEAFLARGDNGEPRCPRSPCSASTPRCSRTRWRRPG